MRHADGKFSVCVFQYKARAEKVKAGMANTKSNKGPVKGAGTKAEAKGPEKVSPIKFIAQTRQEARKVTWTSWRETLTTTIMVLIMVLLMGAFFFVVDGAFSYITKFVLSFGN